MLTLRRPIEAGGVVNAMLSGGFPQSAVDHSEWRRSGYADHRSTSHHLRMAELEHGSSTQDLPEQARRHKRRQYPAIPERLLTADFTALAFAHTQALSSLSTALGVASARLVGLPWPHVEAGLTQELADSLTSDQWHRNMALAQATSTMTAAWQPLEERETSAVHTSASIAEVTLSLRAHTQRGSDEPDSASGRLLLGNGTRDRWCGAVVQAPHVTSIQHTESLACYKRSVLFISSPMGANDPSVCRSPAAKREDLRLRSWDPYRIPPLAVTLPYL